jgi:hypothetical protein
MRHNLLVVILSRLPRSAGRGVYLCLCVEQDPAESGTHAYVLAAQQSFTV